jgi:DNA (cytosine-5)-methyltransferase 1
LGASYAIALDNNPKVLELYQNNFPDTTVLCKDIGDITATEIRDIIQHKYPDWDGEIAAVIGGPPCQGFSVAGKQNLHDDRSQLVIKFINLVVDLNPTMFVMENVPAIECKKFSQITGNANRQVGASLSLSSKNTIFYRNGCLLPLITAYPKNGKELSGWGRSLVRL